VNLSLVFAYLEHFPAALGGDVVNDMLRVSRPRTGQLPGGDGKSRVDLNQLDQLYFGPLSRRVTVPAREVSMSS